MGSELVPAGEVITLPVSHVSGEAYRPSLALSAVEARQLTQQVREITKAALVEGVDYDRIPGCGPKPSLLKPGAEHLLQFFGYGHDLSEPTIDRDDSGKPIGALAKCTVTKSLPDREVTVASCWGYASTDEPKWRKAPFNTVLKMSQKRALVGAALQACAASQLFSQDLEDYPQDGPRQIEPGDDGGSAVPSPPARPSASAGDPPQASADAATYPDDFALTALRNRLAELDPGIKGAIKEGWRWGSVSPKAKQANRLTAADYDDAWSFVNTTAQGVYDHRRRHCFAKLGEAGIKTEEARHLLVRNATGGATESTAKLTDEQHRAVIEVIDALIAEDGE